jgi:alpha-ketoglutarate-dependent taurine dioxygenase
MIQTKIIEYTSIDDILFNFKIYKTKFLKDSVLAFRGANLSLEEQRIFHYELGKLLSWEYQKESDPGLSEYTENHAHNKKINTAGKDDIMLSWHIEHIYYKNPIVGATWNMQTFNIDSDNGKTYFVDTAKIYKDMPSDWQKFLLKCKTSIGVSEKKNIFAECDVVKPHWITGDQTLRTLFKEHINPKGIPGTLLKFDGKTPTEDEKNFFNTIIHWASLEVLKNEDRRIVHKWQKGDLLVPDMFKLAHAVTGGFDSKDRQFTGIWGFQYPGRPDQDLQYHW